MKKKLIAALLAATVAVGAAPSAGALLNGFTTTRTYRNQFTDVPTNAWYYRSVKSAYELGLTSGTSAVTFSPKKSITADETTAFLARIHAAYHGNAIPDRSGYGWADKYYDYVTAFIDSDYVGDGIYGAAIETRWQFAYWLSLALPDTEYPEINYVPNDQIPDLPVSQYGYPIVNRIYMLYRAGILTGNDAYGTFAPTSDITRAEVTAIIARMIDPSQRKTFTLRSESPSALRGYTGSHFAPTGDAGHPQTGYALHISRMDANGIDFTLQYENSDPAIGFTAQQAIFTSATTAAARGTTYFADQPQETLEIEYVFTFSDRRINLKIYQHGSVLHDIDFECSGTAG